MNCHIYKTITNSMKYFSAKKYQPQQYQHFHSFVFSHENGSKCDSINKVLQGGRCRCRCDDTLVVRVQRGNRGPPSPLQPLAAEEIKNWILGKVNLSLPPLLWLTIILWRWKNDPFDECCCCLQLSSIRNLVLVNLELVSCGIIVLLLISSLGFILSCCQKVPFWFLVSHGFSIQWGKLLEQLPKCLNSVSRGQKTDKFLTR